MKLLSHLTLLLDVGEVKALSQISARLIGLGRKLKHDSDQTESTECGNRGAAVSSWLALVSTV